MIKIANAQFWVHDQDEALAFYTRTLGWEVRVGRVDGRVELPLAGGRTGRPGRRRAGAHARPTARRCSTTRRSGQLAELVAKGAGGTLFLETDDCQAAYDELSARGVVFNDPPTPQPYGIDTSFRDPSGNNIRLTQVLEFAR